MGLFSAFVGVVVETVKLPVAIVKDVVTLGGSLDDKGSYTVNKLKDIKDEAEKADD